MRLPSRNIDYILPTWKLNNGRKGAQEAGADAPGVGGAGKYRGVQSRRDQVSDAPCLSSRRQEITSRVTHTDQSCRDVEVWSIGF